MVGAQDCGSVICSGSVSKQQEMREEKSCEFIREFTTKAQEFLLVHVNWANTRTHANTTEVNDNEAISCIEH